MVRLLIAALLAAGASAMQVAPDLSDAGGRICKVGTSPFEAFDALAGTCTVYCVPEGECLGQAQVGLFGSVGVVGQGNCMRHGYTAPAPRDRLTAQKAAFLQRGPCKGMTLATFQKPLDPSAASTRAGHCGNERVAYESITPDAPGVCYAYCVPAGECELHVGSGQLRQYGIVGITGQGNCHRKGYTKRGTPSPVRGAARLLEHKTGPCKGLTFDKFEKPMATGAAGAVVAAAAANTTLPQKKRRLVPKPATTRKPPQPDPFCPAGMRSYETGPRAESAFCGVYCVPKGQCNELARTGRLAGLGISGPGHCVDKGFTEPAFLAQSAVDVTLNLERLQAMHLCEGVTYHGFRMPAQAQQ